MNKNRDKRVPRVPGANRDKNTARSAPGADRDKRAPRATGATANESVPANGDTGAPQSGPGADRDDRARRSTTDASRDKRAPRPARGAKRDDRAPRSADASRDRRTPQPTPDANRPDRASRRAPDAGRDRRAPHPRPSANRDKRAPHATVESLNSLPPQPAPGANRDKRAPRPARGGNRDQRSRRSAPNSDRDRQPSHVGETSALPQPGPGFRSGFVSLVGRPNAGKSTLLNALVGQKVAIVADKPQTTRTSIQGVLTTPESQIVFIDTPGIHRADSPLNKRLMDAVHAALEERDLLLFLADAVREVTDEDRRSVDIIHKTATPVVLVLNKIDLVKEKSQLLPVIEQYKAMFDFADYVPVSALKGKGLDDLRRVIVSRLPEGPAYFPEDHVTDQPERFLAAELVREKVLLATRQEVPHSVTVTVDLWEETPKLTRIYATIRVERDGQKGIVIGAGGAMLKRIGTLARAEMERLFGIKIYLDLHVRVQPGWREKSAFLDSLDWRTMAGDDEA